VIFFFRNISGLLSLDNDDDRPTNCVDHFSCWNSEFNTFQVTLMDLQVLKYTLPKMACSQVF
jgi:hypothetical protein